MDVLRSEVTSRQGHEDLDELGHELATQLLSFSRRGALELQPIDLAELLRRLERLLSRTLAAEGRAPPTLFISGFASTDVGGRGPLLHKPFSEALLLARVRERLAAR